MTFKCLTKNCPVPSTLCDLSMCKVKVVTSKSLGEDAFTRKYIILMCDLDLWVKVIQKIAQRPLHHVTYPCAKFKVVTSKSLEDAFTRKYIILTCDLDLWVKVIQKIAQYPLHHVTYPCAKFKVVTSKS